MRYLIIIFLLIAQFVAAQEQFSDEVFLKKRPKSRRIVNGDEISTLYPIFEDGKYLKPYPIKEIDSIIQNLKFR